MLIFAIWDAVERPRDPPLSAFCGNGMGYFLVSRTGGVYFSLTYKHWIYSSHLVRIYAMPTTPCYQLIINPYKLFVSLSFSSRFWVQ